jgi:hypothetical protein
VGHWWSRLPTGILIAGMFAVGAWRVSTTDDTWDGVALMTAALILTGVAITEYLRDKWR